MKLIGKGAFSKVYLSDGEVVVKSDDPAKECLALFCQGNKYAPEIERVDYDEVSTYKMPFYPKITAPKKQLNTQAYELYKKLRKVFAQGHTALQKELGFDKELLNLVNSMGNYGTDTLRFEISPRNITTNDNGDLILLDCFFFSDHLAKTLERA